MRADLDLLERDAELHHALALLDRSVGGQGGCLCVLGAPGVGKTALVRRVAAGARARGARVLTATAGELESHAPFGVVRQLLDRAGAGLDAEERERVSAGPARVAGDFLTASAPAQPVEQSAMLNSLFWLVDALAAAGPLVLVVDDAQWADASSLLFLQHLLTRLDDQPVLVVVAARDGQPDRRTAPLAALVAAATTTVRLNPLSDAGVHSFLARAWGEGVSAPVAAACAEVTGGNPFLVVALTDLLGHDTAGADVDRVRGAVPESVVDTVVHRLSALPPVDQDIARWVAVLDSTTLRTVAALAEVEPAEAAAAADRLRDSGILAEGEGLSFRHALLRSAVDRAVGPDTRAAHHRQAARLLAADPEQRHAAAAHLLAAEGVGDPWAVALLVSAAGEAVAAGSPPAAVGLLRRALAEPPDAAALPGVLLDLGLAELRSGDPACVTTLERAEQVVADPTAHARCALALAMAYNFAGFYLRSVVVLERALARLGAEHGDLALVVEAGLVSAALQVPSHVDDARRRLAARPDLTGATPGERLFLLQQASYANATAEPVARVRELARLAIGDGLTPEQHPDTHEWAVARLQLAATGEYAEVVRLCERGLAVSAAAGSVVGFVAGSYVRGLSLLWAGALGPAEVDLRAALGHADLVPGGTLVSALVTAALAEVLVERGDVAGAFEVLAAVGDDVTTDSSFNGGIHLLRARGVALVAAGRYEEALEVLDECSRRLDDLAVDSPTWCSWRPVAVAAGWALGRGDRARDLAREDVAHAETKGAAVALGVALRLVGECAGDDAVGPLLRSVAVLEQTEARLEEARSRVALGAALRRTGHKAEAREHLLVGRVAASQCGAEPLVRLAEIELAASGSRPRRLDVEGLGALTASELRVCELAAAGLRNREIAQRLFIAPKTVEIHLSRSYRKLGIAGRSELAKVGVVP